MNRIIGWILAIIVTLCLIGASFVFVAYRAVTHDEVIRDYEDGKLVNIGQAIQYDAVNVGMLKRFLEYSRGDTGGPHQTKKALMEDFTGVTRSNKEILIAEKYSNFSKNDRKDVASIVSVYTGHQMYMNLYFDAKERFLGGNIQAP